MTQTQGSENKNTFNIPEVIPILALQNVMVFPKTMIPLEVTGSASVLVDEAMTKDRLVGLIMSKRSRTPLILIPKRIFMRWAPARSF